jgi:hypothetical protein
VTHNIARAAADQESQLMVHALFLGGTAALSAYFFFDVLECAHHTTPHHATQQCSYLLSAANQNPSARGLTLHLLPPRLAQYHASIVIYFLPILPCLAEFENPTTSPHRAHSFDLGIPMPFVHLYLSGVRLSVPPFVTMSCPYAIRPPHIANTLRYSA